MMTVEWAWHGQRIARGAGLIHRMWGGQGDPVRHRPTQGLQTARGGAVRRNVPPLPDHPDEEEDDVKRYLIKYPDGRLAWVPGAPGGAKVISELPPQCPRCTTGGGLTMLQSGQVNCAECQKLIRQPDNR